MLKLISQMALLLASAIPMTAHAQIGRLDENETNADVTQPTHEQSMRRRIIRNTGPLPISVWGPNVEQLPPDDQAFLAGQMPLKTGQMAWFWVPSDWEFGAVNIDYYAPPGTTRRGRGPLLSTAVFYVPKGVQWLDIGYSFLPDPRQTSPPAHPSLFTQEFPILEVPSLPNQSHYGGLTILADGEFVMDYSVNLFFLRVTRRVEGTLIPGDLDPISMTREAMLVSNSGIFFATIDEWTREVHVELPILNGFIPVVFR